MYIRNLEKQSGCTVKAFMLHPPIQNSVRHSNNFILMQRLFFHFIAEYIYLLSLTEVSICSHVSDKVGALPVKLPYAVERVHHTKVLGSEE